MTNPEVERRINPAVRIQRFFQTKTNWLQRRCPNPNDCFLVGSHVPELTKYFEGFTNFNLVQHVRKIAQGMNGFINELTYTKHGFTAYALLKSSFGGDNLAYEYLVGKFFVNSVSNYFPCFVETYGLFYYPSEEAIASVLNEGGRLSTRELRELQPQRHVVNVPKACISSKSACVLIQHVQTSMNLYTLVYEKTRNQTFLNDNLLHSLFSVYHALSCLSDRFTHYDFHTGNLLLAWMDNAKYFEYHYHFEDHPDVVFRSPYVPKIIDYGRCYVKVSPAVRRKMVESPECSVCYDEVGAPRSTQDCWDDKGFFFYDKADTYRQFGLDAGVKNESHDLRLLNELVRRQGQPFHRTSKAMRTASESLKAMQRICAQVVYGVGTNHSEKEYGTRENVTLSETHIYNVTGAFRALRAAVSLDAVVQQNMQTYNDPALKIGEFHVYGTDRQMTFSRV